MQKKKGKIMKKYRVCFTKYETYYVDAENEDMAIDTACLLAEESVDSWLDPIDEIEVEEIKIT